MSLPAFILGFGPPFQGPEQRLELSRQCLPDDVFVDRKMAVDKPMPHANDALPGHVRVRVFRCLRYLIGRFTDDLNHIGQSEA